MSTNTYFRVTEFSVFREGGCWHCVTKTWLLSLRPTKGWKKISRTETKHQYVKGRSLPRGWVPGFTRRMAERT